MKADVPGALLFALLGAAKLLEELVDALLVAALLLGDLGEGVDDVGYLPHAGDPLVDGGAGEVQRELDKDAIPTPIHRPGYPNVELGDLHGLLHL